VLHRILLHLPEQAEFLLQGRVRVINVWRPIEYPVHDYPLAVCDPRSVPDSDLVECDHVRRKFKGANMYAHYGPGHKWHYLGGQRPDEVLLLKMFDSDPSAEAKGSLPFMCLPFPVLYSDPMPCSMSARFVPPSFSARKLPAQKKYRSQGPCFQLPVNA